MDLVVGSENGVNLFRINYWHKFFKKFLSPPAEKVTGNLEDLKFLLMQQ